jgi:hypothetical protein
MRQHGLDFKGMAYSTLANRLAALLILKRLTGKGDEPTSNGYARVSNSDRDDKHLTALGGINSGSVDLFYRRDASRMVALAEAKAI